MILTKHPQLIFVHNQKTAGMSIEYLLKKELSGVKLLEQHSSALDGMKKLGKEEWDSYYSFGFVRNPWERLVSWCVMMQETKPRENNKLWDYIHNKANTFEEFILKCTGTITEDRDGYVYEKSFIKPQLEYFTDEEGRIITTFIGRYENLQTEINEIFQQNGLPPYELPVTNTTKKKDYRTYYTEETKEIVAKRFKKDIDYFGYEF